MANTWNPDALPPETALARLMAGNQRFREGKAMAPSRPWHRGDAQVHHPFAVVLGCSDARTPVELLFDQGFGDLFVVRVAGNVVAPSIVGSIEFAVSQFGTRLVVVMGHTECGAIAATVQAIRTGLSHDSRNIRAITDRIAPHITELVQLATVDDDHTQRAAMKANVRASAEFLRRGSRVLEELVSSEHVRIVTAEYDLKSGTVTFF